MIVSINRRFRDVKTTIGELNEDGRGWILATVASGWFLSIGIRVTYPVLLPHVRGAFGFGLSTAGMLLSILWFVYALGQFPGGILADKIGSGNVLTLSTMLSTIAMLVLVTSSKLWILFAGTALLGWCTALYGPARFPMLTAVFPERNGTAIGIVQAMGNLGNTVLPLIAGVLASLIAWQFGFGFTIPLFVLVVGLLRYVVPRRPEGNNSAVDTLSIDSARYLLRGLNDRAVVVVVAIQVLGSSMYQGFTSFYPTYLIEIKGLSPSVASGLFGLFFAMGMIVQPVTGMTGDRFGERQTLITILGLSTVSLAALPFITSFWGLVAITIALSSLLGRAVLTLTYLTNVLSEDIRGTGLGLLRSGYMLIASTSPLLIGLLAAAGRFDEAFLFLAGAGGMMILLTLVLPARG